MKILEGIVVCDSITKKEILSTSDFNNYSFFSVESLESKLYGQCSNKAIFALVDKYNLSYELALEYMHYIPYVDVEKTYNNLKLDSLVTAKKYLIENDLYEIDKLFIFKLKKNPVTFINIQKNTKVNRLMKYLSDYTQVYEIELNVRKYTPVVYEFNDINDECVNLCNKIKKLIDDGVSPSNIYINNIDSDYEFVLKRLANNYRLPISFSLDKNINYLDFSNKFINNCLLYDNFFDVLENLDKNSKFYNTIFNIIIDYDLEYKNPQLYIDFFKFKFKKISFQNPKYKEMICTTSKNKYTDSDYVYYVGLNLGVSPKIYKDDQYLSDDELKMVGLITSIEKNKIEKVELKSLLLETKNIYVSYKKFVGSEEVFQSNIIKELKLDTKVVKVEYGYSVLEDKLRLGIEYSKYLKYKIVGDGLKRYKVDDLKYQSFDNKFKGVDNKFIQEKFSNKKLSLSYTTINMYYQCPFKYYADRILYLTNFKSNMAARLGTFSHAVLEESYSSNFIFDKSVITNTLENAIDDKDRFYFKQMEIVLKQLIEFNKNKESFSKLNNKELEPKIVCNFDEFMFEGFVDKLLYSEIDGEIYAAIIDYKTGRDKPSLDNISNGFNLQLPSYVYLLSKYEKFKGKKINILGIYLQKVRIVALDNTKDVIKQREKNFKLLGYTTSLQPLIPILDPTYFSSSYISGMSVNKSGSFGQYAKVITPQDFVEMTEIVEKLITKAGKNILNGEFEIAPKMIDSVNMSCKYCEYKDLCFMKYSDLVNLEPEEFPKKEMK